MVVWGYQFPIISNFYDWYGRHAPHACTQTPLVTKTTLYISLPCQSTYQSQCYHFNGIPWLFGDLFFLPHVIFIRPGETHTVFYATDISDSHIRRAIRDLAVSQELRAVKNFWRYSRMIDGFVDLREKRELKNMPLAAQAKSFVVIIG